MTAKIHPDILLLARPLASLTPDPRNARKHNERNVREVMASYKEHGQLKPIVVQRSADDGTQLVVRAGNGQVEAARRLGWDSIACTVVDMGDREAVAFALRDNRTAELAEWADEELVWNLDYLGSHGVPASEVGWEPKERAELAHDPYGDGPKDQGALAKRFGVPPFTVLDARQGYWRERKAAWLRAGIDTAAGRDNLSSTVAKNVIGGKRIDRGPSSTGGSGFDPVLAELCCRWFCPAGGRVLDPFAGESTKGIVAAKLGLQYTGVELRQEQVDANDAQAAACGVAPRWVCGDSSHLAQLVTDDGYDLVFTSPPYYDLEIYSKSDKDGSAFETYEKFIEWYAAIMAAACAKLAPNRFAVVKIGEVRDKKTGGYVNFVGDNIRAFVDAGMTYFNEAVLVTPIGSMPLRAGMHFNAGRKLEKGHQNVLVFYKGDPREIGKHYGKVEFGELPVDEEQG